MTAILSRGDELNVLNVFRYECWQTEVGSKRLPIYILNRQLANGIDGFT